MAKTISDEQMKLSIIINGNEAQKELFGLEKSTRSLNEQNKALLLQKKLLEKQGQKDTAQYKLLTATIKENTAVVTANKNRMSELQKEIGLTGLTMSQLQSKATMLRNTLRNLVPGSADYVRYQAELTQVNTRLGELSGRSRTAQSSIASIADTFNRYQGMAIAVIGALTGVVLSIQKIIDINGKLSDAQADVMKTTGMTKVEVDELTKSFGLLQTRTSRIDLLGIAEQGGRIGIAKAELSDFVNVMNKANVSLGDSFTGGAEEVANKLGKIKFLFQETKDLNVDQAYNSIGSAINDLGANGVASEANIADFTTRIGSLTDVLKPTIQETLALGTAFEESGIESEVSARAYGIFMKQASTETAKFAKVMGITQGEVEAMINTNPLEFMLKFSEGMKGMNATDTAKTLDALGISADGANKVIGAMGNNTARFRELIDLSNKSFGEGTSLINEYEIKNNNLAATLEKISKTVSGWFSSETFIKWLGGAVQWLAIFIGATEDADGGITRFKNGLIAFVKITTVVMTAMISYKAALQLIAIYTNGVTSATTLMNVAQKANALTGGLLKTVYLGLQYAYYTLTLQTERATVAQVAFNTATKSNPIALVISLLVALGAAYLILHKNIDISVQKQENLNQVREQANAAVLQEKTNLENLLKIARDETQSKANREAAIKRINEISPDYLKNITLETINTREAKKAIDDYLVSLDKKAMKEAFASKRAELAKKVLDTKKDKEKSKYGGFFEGPDTDFEKTFEDEQRGITTLKQLSYNWNSAKLDAYREYRKSIIDAKLELKDLSEEEAKFLKKNADLYVSNTNTTNSKFTPADTAGKGTGTKKNPNSSLAEINKLKLDEQAKYNEQTLKLSRQLEDDKIAAMQDGYAKELLIENNRYQREIEDLNRQKVHTEELAKLDEDIAKAKESKDTAKYNALLTIRKGWDAKNLALDNQIDAVKEGKLSVHNLKLATLEEKAAKESIEKSKAAFDQAKMLRETKFNEEYAALGTNEKAKAKLKKEFDANELEQETNFLNELIAKFNPIVGKGNLDGIDLSLLTPEQVDTFTAEAAKVGLSLSELIKKKNELSGNTGGTDFGILQGQGTDIFGFSPEQWDSALNNFDTLKEKIGAVETVFGGLQNAWSMYSSFVEANSQKELQQLDKKQATERTKLKKQLDSKQITQAQYDKKIAKLDAEKEKAQSEADYKRAKNEKIGALFSIGVNTAIGVMKAVAASPLTGGLPWSAIIGGMGLLQAGMVLAQPLPAKGHEAGLYPEYVKRSQDGRVFQSKYQGKTRSGLVSDTSHFLVAENGPEMIIDNKAWREMNPAVKDSLIRELNGIKGFEKGLYNQQTQRYEVPAASSGASSSDTQMMQMMMALVAENTATMKELKDKVFLGVVSNKDLKSMGYLQEGINAANELREKSKR